MTTIPAVLLVASTLVLSACSEDLEGPTPAVEDPVAGQQLPVEPGIVCQMQHPAEGTPIVLTGDEFSPVPFDIPDEPKAALPTVTLDGNRELDGASRTANMVEYSGLPDGTNASLLSWQSQQQMTLSMQNEVTLDDGTTGMVPVGLYDVRVTNANDNEDTSLGALAVVDRPRVESTTPGITCLEQGERTITLSGQTVLRIEENTAVVDVGGEVFEVDELSGCTAIAHPAIDAEFCDTVTVTLPASAVPNGFPEVTVDNPETAACSSVHEEDMVNLRVVPAPEITGIVPPMVCVAEGPREVTIEGTGFLDIDGDDPTVTIDGTEVDVVGLVGASCSPLETQGHTVRTCTQITIEVPENMMQTEVITPTVELTNPQPAGCNASTSTDLVIVPPPTIESVEPPLVCVEDGGRQIEVIGSGFIFVDGTAPTVEFDGMTSGTVSQPDSGCNDLAVEGLNVQRCASILVDIPQGGLAPGSPEITVTNPDPAGCSATANDLLTVVPGPELTAAIPPLICTDDGSRTVELQGTGFLDVDGTLPTVTMDGTMVTVDSMDGCMDVQVNGLTVQSCTSINVTVPQGGLTEGDTVVEVTNPAPAGCSISDNVILTVPPTLALTSATPSGECVSGAGGVVSVEVTGTGFQRIDGNDFTVEVDGTAATPTNISGCTMVDVDGLTVESCTSFTVDIDTSGRSVGGVPITVTNPAPDGCTETSATIFAIVEPPTVQSIAPTVVCSDVDDTMFTITGTSFAPTPTVTIGGVPADTVTVACMDSDMDPSTPEDCTANVTFAGGLPESVGGQYDVVVDNGGGCSDTLTGVVQVDPTPIVFFVDPPVVYNGITTDVTIFVSGLEATATDVELVDSAGNVTPLPGFTSPDRPNRILATIPGGPDPADQLPADDYEVRVTSQDGCVGTLAGGLTITDTLTLTLNTIDPAFVSATEPTGVTITADANPGFVEVPRAYLNPSAVACTSDADCIADQTCNTTDGVCEGATATALRAVVLDEQNPATTMSAVVPGGLVPGQYDLIVVNPTGEVGLIEMAVTVTVDEPPFVSSVAPASFDAGGGAQPAVIFGENFDPTGTIMVDLQCENISTGATRGAMATVTAATTNRIDIEVDASGLSAGDVCVVVVTNPDGSQFRFSAISIKEPAQNLNPWIASPDMVEARRGLALTAGRPTSASRFLYALGGDDGMLGNARTSTEAAEVGVFGDMGPWSLQRNDLSSVWDGTQSVSMPRTFARAVTVDQYVYLVGGHDGSGAVDTTLRAKILDPLAGPEIIDLDARLGDATTGLDAGLWHYRVAALFPTSDPENPGGEGLPGEPLPVELPMLNEGVILTLNWDEVPGASGYRVYRTPTAGAPLTDAELLGEIDCGGSLCDCTTTPAQCELTDDGTTMTDSMVTPMPQGSLGVWHTTGQLLPGTDLADAARESHATVVVQNPADASQYWIYVVGGRDGNGTYRDDGSFAAVTVAADGTQTLSSWQPLSATLSTARAEHAGFVVSGFETNIVPEGDTWLYFGQGFTGMGQPTGDFDAGQLTATGDITSFSTLTGPTPSRAGYVGLSANGWLFTLGGSGRMPSNGNDTSAEVVSPPPTLAQWDALGGGAGIAQRIFGDGAEESAFFFIAGGSGTGLNGALRSVERTVQ